MRSLSVVDVLLPREACELSVDERTSLGELRGLCASLCLPSARRFLTTPGRRIFICHDGCVLDADDETELRTLGVLEAPVVVILTRSVPSDPKPSPPLSPQQQEEPQEEAVCRICFGSSYENGAGRLISPCRCIGSMRWAHAASPVLRIASLKDVTLIRISPAHFTTHSPHYHSLCFIPRANLLTIFYHVLLNLSKSAKVANLGCLPPTLVSTFNFAHINTLGHLIRHQSSRVSLYICTRFPCTISRHSITASTHLIPV